jgi:vitamin B12 transporter
MITKQYYGLLATSIALAFCQTSIAADPAQVLDTVQVTANRFAQPANQTTSSVTVIDRDAIEKSQALDVADLLIKQVGIDVVRTGGSGSLNTIFMRGGNSNHTLILVDGIRVNSATQGIFDMAHMPLATIERIEIVRGPRAALWGSDALSGVIHIFTRAPKALTAELRAGSFQRYGGDIGYGFGDEQSNIGFIAGTDNSEGFSSTNSNNYYYNPDKDGYRNNHFALNAQTQLGSQTLKFAGLTTDARVEFDQGVTFAKNHSWSTALFGEINAQWSHNLTVGQAYEKNDTPDYASIYGSRRSSLDWSNAIAISDNTQIGVGVNWVKEKGYSNDFFGEVFKRTRNNAGIFATVSSKWQAHTFDLATRYDDNSQYGSNSTSSAGWAFQANANNRIRASWSQGFRAPNLNELYSPGFGGFFAGNPLLNPERSRSAELGYVFSKSAAFEAEISAYQNNVDDLISFAGFQAQAINISRADIKGLEVDLRGQFNAFNWRAQATYTDAINEDTGNALLRRPKLKGLASLSYAFDNQFVLGTELTGYSDRPDAGAQLPGYGRLDLTASWPLSDTLRLEGRIENLLDKNYQLLNGYSTPERSVFIRLSYQAK